MEWISVDHHPKLNASNESENVLVVEKDGDMFAAHLNYYPVRGDRTEEVYIWSENSTGCGCCVRSLEPTHWMPLPKPPEDKDAMD